MQKLHKNIFTGGLDKDTTLENVRKNTYIDSSGVTISEDNELSSLVVRKGDELYLELGANEKILKLTEALYKNGTVIDSVLIIFSLDVTLNIIKIYRVVDGVAPSAILIGAYSVPNLSVDSFQIELQRFTEGGVDTLYFVDGVTQPKQIKLEEEIISQGTGTIAG